MTPTQRDVILHQGFEYMYEKRYQFSKVMWPGRIPMKTRSERFLSATSQLATTLSKKIMIPMKT